MLVKTVVVGELETNCYIVIDDESREGVVIDPGDEGEGILHLLEELKAKVRYILNTHGHMDHIGANRIIKERTGAQLLIHEEDAHMLTDGEENLSALFDLCEEEMISLPPDRTLKDGDVIDVNGLTLEVIHTPGHTRGSVAFKAGNTFFTGDTLFADSVGRTDLPGGSYETLMGSIRRLLGRIDDEALILPGHGPGLTLREMRKINPYLSGI